MRVTAVSPSRRSQVPTRRMLRSIATGIPAPVWGWDASNPVAKMPADHAIRLKNWFPQPEWVELRNGYIRQCDTGTGRPVESLMAYQGLVNAKLFAASDGRVFDVTTDTPTVGVTGLANTRIQHIIFSTTGGTYLYCVNGGDDPFYFDGTSWQTAAITGSGIDATEWVQVNAFKSRIFAIKNNSTSFDYLDVDSIQGSATSYELGGYMTMGGYLMAMATWSVDAGDGPDDYAVFITSRGQVIIFRGLDPNEAESWSLVGVFNMGQPIGRRCFYKVGADVAIICVDGVLPLSRAMIFERAATVKISLTERIQREMNAAARAYHNNFGWQLISYPQGTRAILNIPVRENVEQKQFVMNTITGAWCEFDNHNGSCWELLNDSLFFGGNNGVVYQADASGADDGDSITADMMTAFVDYGSSSLKRWVECQPLLDTDGSVKPAIAFNVDFNNNAPLSVAESVIVPGSTWDNAAWDHALWPGDVSVQTNWLAASGVGHWMSIRLVVHIQSDSFPDAVWGDSLWGADLWYSPSGNPPAVTLRLNGFNVAYERGAAYI